MNKNYLLLTGAGFSHNWGGWLAAEILEYLIGCKEVYSDNYLKNKLWELKDKGFEEALGQIQLEYENNNREEDKERLKSFNKSLLEMFDTMNKNFVPNNHDTYNKICSIITPLEPLLAEFNAIFTLNQDLLLEYVYTPPVGFKRENPWEGVYIPGMKPINEQCSPSEPIVNSNFLWKKCTQSPSYSVNSITPAMTPINNDKFILEEKKYQPYFKLHGSCNWKDKDDNNILIMGSNKSNSIKHHSILEWYQYQFSDYLSKPNTHLMIIGYSFTDTHINDAITKSTEENSDLKIYIIDPKGIDILNNVKKNLFHFVVGASRRSLTESFTSDAIENAKIMKFFKTDY